MINSTELMKKWGMKFIREELKRYGNSCALRGKLSDLEFEQGVLATTLPLSILEKVAKCEDSGAFNGSLRFFGASDEMIESVQSKELFFLTGLLSTNWGDARRLFSCRSYSQCVLGKECRTGRNEILTLLHLKVPISGSSFEGWSEKNISGEYSVEDVRETLAYASLPYPPGVGIVSSVRENSLGQAEITRPRVLFQDEEWIHLRLKELQTIVVSGFDNEGLVFWIPPGERGESIRRFAIECNLTAV